MRAEDQGERPERILPVVVQGADTLFARSDGLAASLDGPRAHEALFAALDTAFLYGPAELARNALARRSGAFEGVVSYAFHGEYPDETARGTVLVCAFESEAQVPVTDFLRAVLALLLVAHEAGGRELGPWVGRLRRHLALRLALPRVLSRPFTPRLAYDVFETMPGRPAGRVAEILSDGRHGRVIAHRRDAGRLVAAIAAAPLHRRPMPARPVADDRGLLGDPAGVPMPPFEAETLRRLAAEEFPRHRLRAAPRDV